MFERISGYLDLLAAADHLAEVHEIMSAAVDDMGFDCFGYVSIQYDMRRVGPRYLGNCPPGWPDESMFQGISRPGSFVETVFSGTAPVNWKQLAGPGSNGNGDAACPLTLAARLGLNNGITVPVRGPGPIAALLNVAGDIDDRRFEELWRDVRLEIQILALHGHDAVLRVASDADAPAPGILSPRERECLLWAARGKTAWETARILQLSQDTVVGYLKSACAKFGAGNKTQAAVTATLHNLIAP